MKGTRFISDYFGSKSSSTITVIGTDDGSTFWTLYGQYTSDDGSALVKASIVPTARCGSLQICRPLLTRFPQLAQPAILFRPPYLV